MRNRHAHTLYITHSCFQVLIQQVFFLVASLSVLASKLLWFRVIMPPALLLLSNQGSNVKGMLLAMLQHYVVMDCDFSTAANAIGTVYALWYTCSAGVSV